MAMTSRPVVPWLSAPSSVQRTTRKLHLNPSSPSPQHSGSFPLLLQPSFLHHSVLPLLKKEKGCLLVACLPSPPPSSESSATATTKLYVSGLSFRTTKESLRNAFQNFGQLVEVNLVMDRVANRPRGFAFLRYATENEAKKAIEGMHGKFLDGRVIFVEVAKPRTEPRRDAKQTPRQF